MSTTNANKSKDALTGSNVKRHLTPAENAAVWGGGLVAAVAAAALTARVLSPFIAEADNAHILKTRTEKTSEILEGARENPKDYVGIVAVEGAKAGRLAKRLNRTNPLMAQDIERLLTSEATVWNGSTAADMNEDLQAGTTYIIPIGKISQTEVPLHAVDPNQLPE
jgi:hypothetical protein